MSTHGGIGIPFSLSATQRCALVLIAASGCAIAACSSDDTSVGADAGGYDGSAASPDAASSDATLSADTSFGSDSNSVNDVADSNTSGDGADAGPSSDAAGEGGDAGSDATDAAADVRRGTGGFSIGAHINLNGAGDASNPSTTAGWGIATADVNGDGAKDLVVANHDRNVVTVLLGIGNGTFMAPFDVPVGATPVAVAIADVDLDGKLDIVAANSGDGTLTVARGAGDGGFVPNTAFASGGAFPSFVAVADLDGDGVPDLAVSNNTTGNVAVLRGGGDAGFGAPKLYAGIGDPWDIIPVDLNGDNRRDLVIGTGRAAVVVLLNGGDGGFVDGGETVPALVEGGTGPTQGPYGVVMGDFSGRGKIDLATANWSAGTVSILLGNGDGSFQSATPQRLAAVLAEPYGITSGDYNGDGRPDLAAAMRTSGVVGVVLNDGGGGLGLPTYYDAGGKRPSSLVTADFNGDGVLDIAVMVQEAAYVQILLGL
jgi:hypothetical protein